MGIAVLYLSNQRWIVPEMANSPLNLQCPGWVRLHPDAGRVKGDTPCLSHVTGRG